MPSLPALNNPKATLIHLLQCLVAGDSPETIKPQFLQILRQTSPLEIALLESELIREKHPQQEILRLYGLQVEIFRELYAQ
jgi:DUF438 domain-containing protein